MKSIHFFHLHNLMIEIYKLIVFKKNENACNHYKSKDVNKYFNYYIFLYKPFQTNEFVFPKAI